MKSQIHFERAQSCLEKIAENICLISAQTGLAKANFSFENGVMTPSFFVRDLKSPTAHEAMGLASKIKNLEVVMMEHQNDFFHIFALINKNSPNPNAHQCFELNFYQDGEAPFSARFSLYNPWEDHDYLGHVNAYWEQDTTFIFKVLRFFATAPRSKKEPLHKLTFPSGMPTSVRAHSIIDAATMMYALYYHNSPSAYFHHTNPNLDEDILIKIRERLDNQECV